MLLGSFHLQFKSSCWLRYSKGSRKLRAGCWTSRMVWLRLHFSKKASGALRNLGLKPQLRGKKAGLSRYSFSDAMSSFLCVFRQIFWKRLFFLIFCFLLLWLPIFKSTAFSLDKYVLKNIAWKICHSWNYQQNTAASTEEKNQRGEGTRKERKERERGRERRLIKPQLVCI